MLDIVFFEYFFKIIWKWFKFFGYKVVIRCLENNYFLEGNNEWVLNVV